MPTEPGGTGAGAVGHCVRAAEPVTVTTTDEVTVTVTTLVESYSVAAEVEEGRDELVQWKEDELEPVGSTASVVVPAVPLGGTCDVTPVPGHGAPDALVRFHPSDDELGKTPGAVGKVGYEVGGARAVLFWLIPPAPERVHGAEEVPVVLSQGA